MKVVELIEKVYKIYKEVEELEGMAREIAKIISKDLKYRQAVAAALDGISWVHVYLERAWVAFGDPWKDTFAFEIGSEDVEYLWYMLRNVVLTLAMFFHEMRKVLAEEKYKSKRASIS